jgi:hypothetical protein
MNSVTMVRPFRRKRSMTLNAPQKFSEALENQSRMPDARHGT